jgi:uncharacterized protein YtpQ (UPF0354 family)
VWDEPNGMRFATEAESEQYAMSLVQMIERAKANFLKHRPAVTLSEHGPLLVAQTRDCYDATLLVDDDWLMEMSARLQGNLIACAPARHILLIGGDGREGTVKEMRHAAERIELGGDHLITNTILVRRDGKWEEFRESPVPGTRAEATKTPPKRPWWRLFS